MGYKKSGPPKDFEEAQAICEQQGGTLPKLVTPERMIAADTAAEADDEYGEEP